MKHGPSWRQRGLGFGCICTILFFFANQIQKSQDSLAPFATTPEGLRLADFVAGISEEYDLGKMGQIFLGGGSDASYITIAGVPTVCSTGVRGQFNHTSKEYAEVESLYNRAKLFCAVVLNIEKFAAGN